MIVQAPAVATSRRVARSTVVLGVSVLLVVLAACGGNAPPPSAPASQGVPASTAASPSDSNQDGVTESVDGTPRANVVRPSSDDVRAIRTRARAELDRAERELDASSGDCAAACRALSSMERATRHLCDLAAASPEDSPRCDDARHKVHVAEERVRSTCGACPGMP